MDEIHLVDDPMVTMILNTHANILCASPPYFQGSARHVWNSSGTALGVIGRTRSTHTHAVSIAMLALDEHALFTAVDLLSSQLATSAVGALRCCSHPLVEATERRMHEVRQQTECELRAQLAKTSWGPCACRKGALRLSGQPITSDLPTLLRLAALSRVSELRLRNICLGGQAMGMIAAAAGRHELDTLRIMDVSHNFIDDRCVEHLAERALQPHRRTLPNLRTLNLSSNCFGDRGMAALCDVWRDGAALAELACLRIAANPDIGCEKIRALAACITSGALRSLAELVVPKGHERNAALASACIARRIKLL